MLQHGVVMIVIVKLRFYTRNYSVVENGVEIYGRFIEPLRINKSARLRDSHILVLLSESQFSATQCTSWILVITLSTSCHPLERQHLSNAPKTSNIGSQKELSTSEESSSLWDLGLMIGWCCWGHLYVQIMPKKIGPTKKHHVLPLEQTTASFSPPLRIPYVA